MSDESRNFCQGITKNGKPCRARPMPGGLCFFHANPDQARILGQKGGRGNGYHLTELVLPDDATVANLGTLLDQTIGELLAGRMAPRVASTVAKLVSTRARLAQTLELTARVANLERKLADRGSAAAVEASPAGAEWVGPLWWMPEQNGNEGGGDGNGNTGKP